MDKVEAAFSILAAHLVNVVKPNETTGVCRNFRHSLISVAVLAFGTALCRFLDLGTSQELQFLDAFERPESPPTLPGRSIEGIELG